MDGFATLLSFQHLLECGLPKLIINDRQYKTDDQEKGKKGKKRSQRKQNSKTHVLVFWNLAFKLSIQNTYYCFRKLKYAFWNSAFFGFFSFPSFLFLDHLFYTDDH